MIYTKTKGNSQIQRIPSKINLNNSPSPKIIGKKIKGVYFLITKFLLSNSVSYIYSYYYTLFINLCGMMPSSPEKKKA